MNKSKAPLAGEASFNPLDLIMNFEPVSAMDTDELDQTIF